MRFRTLAAASVLLLLPALAHADSFTYNVNDNFSSFSVTGTITTDTNSGSLATSDITDFNLLLQDGTSSIDLTSANSQRGVIGGGGSLLATGTGLFFNFDNTTGDQLIFQYSHLGNAGQNYLCYEGVNGGCDGSDAHESINITSGKGAVNGVQAMSGDREIASMNTAATPEPESLVLLGTGLFGLCGVVRRKVVR